MLPRAAKFANINQGLISWNKYKKIPLPVSFKSITIRGGKMMQNIGIPGLILLLVIALIIFGPSKLPEIGRAVGSTLKEFKNSTKDLLTEDKSEQSHKEKPNKE